MEFFETLKQASNIAGSLSAIIAVCVLLIKPLREKVFGIRAIVSGIKCVLRYNMLDTYYKWHDKDEIRQYERENFDAEYRAYKALGGNSFIDTINDEVRRWEVIP